MADQNANNGSLALIRQALASQPLNISGAPAAAGAAPLAGLLGQAVKSFQAHQLRSKAIDLIDREQLAEKFDAIASDPRYDKDLQTEAEQHSNVLRMLHPDDKPDKIYQPDKKDGTIPALNRILYKWHQRETAKRGGEPPPPPEPEQPAEPPAPNAGGASASGYMPDYSTEQGAVPPPLAPEGSAGGMSAAPGGVHLGANAITTGAAVPPPPAPPSSAPAGYPAGLSAPPAGVDPPPGPDYDLTVARRGGFEQAAHEAEQSSIAETRYIPKAQAQALGYDVSGVPDGGTVPVNVNSALARPFGAIAAANIRANTAAEQAGATRDGSGHWVAKDPASLTPLQKSRIARANAQIDAERATADWKRMLTAQGPTRTQAAITQAGASWKRAEAALKSANEQVRQGMVKYPSDIVGGGYTMLNANAQKSLAELYPRLREANELKGVFAPFKDDNVPFENAWSRFEYAFGRNPQTAIGKYISEIELFRVQAAGSLTKGQSRSLQLWEQAALHTPTTAKDSPQLLYQKLNVISKVLHWQSDDTVKFGNKFGLVKLEDLQDTKPYSTSPDDTESGLPPMPRAEDNPAPRNTSSNIGPPPITERVEGVTTWDSPKGRMVWAGKGWRLKAKK